MIIGARCCKLQLKEDIWKNGENHLALSLMMILSQILIWHNKRGNKSPQRDLTDGVTWGYTTKHDECGNEGSKPIHKSNADFSSPTTKIQDK